MRVLRLRRRGHCCCRARCVAAARPIGSLLACWPLLVLLLHERLHLRLRVCLRLHLCLCLRLRLQQRLRHHVMQLPLAV